MDRDALDAQLLSQDGVIATRQLLAIGLTKADLDRLVRRRELTRVHRGVYVDHTGALTWRQRAWAAVLHAEPAALCLASATDAPGRDEDATIHVAIDESRRVTAPPGVRLHRVVDLAAKVRWSQSPPRMRVEDNLLERVHRARDRLEVVRLLTDEVHGRRTTVERVRAALGRRSRLRRRQWVARLLDDLEQGACSVLEHGYLTLVERPHGLPRPARQRVRIGRRGREYRDVEYDHGLVVELDGRLGHDSWAAGGRDAERDLDDQAAGRTVVRIRYAQVYDRHCRTALRLVQILRRRGWTGTPRACGAGCDLAAP